MSRAIVISVGAGLISALFTLSILLGSMGAMILAYLAPLPIFAVGLMLGAPASLIATGAGAIMVALTANWLPALAFVATTGAPCWLIVRQALLSRQTEDGSTEWYPPGLLLLWLAGYILALMGIVAVLAGPFIGGIAGQITAMINELAASDASAQFGVDFTVLASPDVLDFFLTVLPGAVGASWLILMVVNASLAQGALSATGRAQRPNPRMADIELPVWASVVLIAALAGGVLFGGFIALVSWTVALTGTAVFMFAGLGLIHAMMAGRPARLPVLIGLYALIAIVAWPVFFVAGLAVLEPWTRLRARLARAPDNGSGGGGGNANE